MLRGALVFLPLLLLVSCGGATRLEVVSDECLGDEQKAFPGVCGCGIPDELCLPLKSALVHRYAFDGSGAVAVDDVGDADGEIINARLSGSGELVLARDELAPQYVNLPNGIISALGSATFETWLIWEPHTPGVREFWERIFDFGVSTAGENQREGGESYIFFAPMAFRCAYLNTMLSAEVIVESEAAFPVGVLTHMAVVVDDAAMELRLYLNGVEQDRAVLDQPLSRIVDVNNWLGRSQFEQDTTFGGTFREFRIYAAALSQQQLQDSIALGESPAFLAPERSAAQEAREVDP